MDKTNFLLYKDFKPNIDILTDEQAGKLFKAVYAYVNGRVETDFKGDGMLIATFTMLKTTLERDLKKYKKTVDRNRKNGSKGGRPPKKAQETHSVNEKPKKPTRLNENPKNPSEPKKADSDSVSDRDSVIDSDKKEKSTKKKKTSRFTKPTIEELKSYKKERQANVDVNRFYDYYESKGLYVGKNKMKDWKAAFRGWVSRQKDFNKNQPKDNDQYDKNNLTDKQKEEYIKMFGENYEQYI